MADVRTVLVTGVSGHVAGAMADRLAAGGLRVRVMVRTPAQARIAVQAGWQPVTGDLAAPGSLGASVDGADLVVHAAAYLGKDKDLAQAVNVEGTRQLAQAALAAGAGRFVHISTMSVHGDPQPDGLEEDSPLAIGAAHPYVATKAAAEVALDTVRSRGLPTVVLRPGAICSLVNSQWGDELVARLRQSGWPAACHPGDVIPWVHTGDLAEMTWLAATHPAAGGETFLAVDRCVAIRDYFVPIMTALGQTFTAPDRDPVVSRCRIGKIRTVLGYVPRRAFGQTIAGLTALARSMPAPECR
jgi:nucleoside-diphosphate-sugar epimerase